MGQFSSPTVFMKISMPDTSNTMEPSKKLCWMLMGQWISGLTLSYDFEPHLSCFSQSRYCLFLALWIFSGGRISCNLTGHLLLSVLLLICFSSYGALFLDCQEHCNQNNAVTVKHSCEACRMCSMILDAPLNNRTVLIKLLPWRADCEFGTKIGSTANRYSLETVIRNMHNFRIHTWWKNDFTEGQ